MSLVSAAAAWPLETKSPNFLGCCAPGWLVISKHKVREHIARLEQAH
jgi:hypothetical protein